MSPRIERSNPCASRIAGRALAAAVAVVFVTSDRARAIPSPDLVVNLFASAAQVLGLVSIVLGSWFFRGRTKRGVPPGSSRAWRNAFAAACTLFVLTALGWGFFALDARDQRERRLHVNLERSSKEDGRTVGDVSLKELSFSEQRKRDDGLQTSDIPDLMSAGKFRRVYDVRESEEFEVGRIAGAEQVRYPDLMQAPEKYLVKGEPVLLLCFNGNRSSEMCAELREHGYDVSFIVGGYEKWIAEDRPLDMASGAARRELRELPDYPNKDVLLDTDDVMGLLEEGDVLFVDVRYPGEYEGLGHLPGAINVPARKLTSPELDAALRALPKKPVVIPCYDRRSSFYASIIGLKLSRMGFEFLGRYTTPEGFWIPGKDKPHVAAWKAEQEEKTLFGVVAAPLKVALKAVAGWTGSLVLAIALCVLALRLVVLPLALKSERDRLVQAALKPRFGELAVRCRGDGRAVSRKTLELLKAERVRPVLNLVATIVQLVLFTVFFGVVGGVAKGAQHGWAWIPDLGEADPRYVLPIVVGLLLGALVVASAASATRARLVVALAAAVAIGALVSMISAATNVYLVLNLLLLLAQTLAVRAWFERRQRDEATPDYADSAVVPLRDSDRAEGCGNKAIRLAQLARAGLPVPDGFVVTRAALERRRSAGSWFAKDRIAIERAFATLGAERVAVRSSGLKEDGADKSYAGVFESILDVRAETLFTALDEVAESLASARAQVYSGSAAEFGAVLVQRMVPAEFAGVLFTEHPATSGACAVELVRGLGDALVSGRADPMGFRFGRVSGRPWSAKDASTAPPVELAPLLELGRRVEALFGRPQDVEWAYADGRFLLLQARDITRRAGSGSSPTALRERERARLLELARGARQDEVVLGQNELSELLPEPTPYSLSWMEAMWAHSGSTDLACRELGMPYDVDPDSPAFVVGAFGATFVNRREERARLSKGPGALASFRLSRAADELERAWREDHLPTFLREARLREALDLEQLSFKELVELHAETERRILEESYLAAERVNIAADFYMKSAVRALEKHGLDPAQHLAHLPETVVHQAMERLAAAGRGEADLSAFQKLFGHRAPQDYELSQARYAENPKLARAMAQRAGAHSANSAPHATPELGARVLKLQVERARRFQALKEEAKHHALRDFAFLRTLLVEMGERLHVGDGIFQLVRAEIAHLAEPAFRQEEAPRRIRERQESARAFQGVPITGEVTLAMLEELELEQPVHADVGANGRKLKGLRVSGSGGVVGRARVLRTSEEIDHFQDGEVLVARFTDPTWTPVFPRARGIVTEVGGWLSHAAIQAREYDLTAVVGVAGAMQSLTTGDLVALHADGAVERLPERRAEDRVEVHETITLCRDTEELPGELADLSIHGALLLVPGHRLDVGEDVQLVCRMVPAGVDATIVRNGVPGIYGVRFRRPVTGSRRRCSDAARAPRADPSTFSSGRDIQIGAASEH
ncbi:MAG: YidC/Oxa1 family membrane protein insertase [Planctomycetes bacterium]|nr:YidC/Oxa1 family membrane protein insertase [Planctomycetota bacterium]